MPISAGTPFLRRIALGAVFVCLAPAAAFAQAGRDPAPNWLQERVDGLEKSLAFFGSRDERPASPQYAQPAQSSMADVAVRLDRLENQIRQLNGKLDEIQFQGRKNEDGLKRFQGDVDFRFQEIESKGGGSKPASNKRGDAGDLGGSSSVQEEANSH